MPESEDTELRRRAFWSGTITFGLVSVPVALFPGNRRQQPSLRMLGKDGTPLRRRFYCPEENRPVDTDEIIRGYEIEKNRYVVVTDEELEALEPEKSKEINLTRFVPIEQINPIYFDRAYFLAPAGDSKKPYQLLAETMERTKRAGIATFVMRGKEYLVAILAENGILRAETLRFAEEIRTPDDVGLPEPMEVPDSKVKAMAKEIDAAAQQSLDEAELKDHYSERLLKLISKKKASGKGVIQAGPEYEKEEEEEGGKVIDLMEILKRSMGQTRSRGSSGKTQAVRARQSRGDTTRDPQKKKQERII